MAKGDFEYIYNELYVLLDDLGLEIEGVAGWTEEEARKEVPDFRYRILKEDKSIAYGEILYRRCSDYRVFLRKIKEIQKVARQENIPFCYLPRIRSIVH